MRRRPRHRRWGGFEIGTPALPENRTAPADRPGSSALAAAERRTNRKNLTSGRNRASFPSNGAPLGEYRITSLSDVDVELAVGVSAKMLAAAAFDDRWDAIRETLEMLGASAVNVAALCRRSALPFWFRSSLPPQALSDYVSEGLMASDLIIRHAAASSAPFHWRTADRTGHEDDPARRAFVNFVRDCGHRSIVCLTVRPNPGRTSGSSPYARSMRPAR